MTVSWWSRRDRRRSRPPADQPVICRFVDCDDDATDTVGTVALCALHCSFVTELLSEGIDVFDRTDAAQSTSPDRFGGEAARG